MKRRNSPAYRVVVQAPSPLQPLTAGAARQRRPGSVADASAAASGLDDAASAASGDGESISLLSAGGGVDEGSLAGGGGMNGDEGNNESLAGSVAGETGERAGPASIGGGESVLEEGSEIEEKDGTGEEQEPVEDAIEDAVDDAEAEAEAEAAAEAAALLGPEESGFESAFGGKSSDSRRGSVCVGGVGDLGDDEDDILDGPGGGHADQLFHADYGVVLSWRLVEGKGGPLHLPPPAPGYPVAAQGADGKGVGGCGEDGKLKFADMTTQQQRAHMYKSAVVSATFSCADGLLFCELACMFQSKYAFDRRGA